MSNTIHNPVLRGFHPDPSLCRVGDDYYLATSTFEWFPGVWLHHSRDLCNWRPLGGALNRISQIDMRGCQNSGGVWAPCLTHADGRFWLVYTNVRHHGAGVVLDTPNFLVTADHIEGPWSEPLYLNSRGFDPSLFHDDDGRKYLVQMQTGEAVTPRRFDGIILQEFDPTGGRLIGAPRKIWEGSSIGITEGPHLLRREGWVYLITAEGGTSERHAVSVARSRDLHGPYELHPENPLLTSYQDENRVLWSAGHGSLVETAGGDWFMAHLCQRPLQRPGRLVLDREVNKSVPLGRETALQAIAWREDGWPVLAGGGNRPSMKIQVALPEHRWPEFPSRRNLGGPGLPQEFQTLREPADASWLSFERRLGWMSLRGRDSLASTFDQSLVARRLQDFNATATTRMRFMPENFKQAAGLISYYDRSHFHYFRLTGDVVGGVKLGVVSSEFDRQSRCEAVHWRVDELSEGLWLRMRMEETALHFDWSLDGLRWETVVREFESTLCGDWVSPQGGFTGTFWGICCQDLATRSAWADFEFFDYQTEKTRLV